MTDAQVVLALAGAILLASIAGIVRAGGPRANATDPDPLEWTASTRRKRNAKRFNEQLKLGSTLLNNLGIALVIAVFVAPATRGDWNPGAIGVALALITISLLHTFAQLVLRLWRSEE